MWFLCCIALLSGEQGAEKEAVRRVLDAQVAAWNKSDLNGFMDGYWRSEELTFFSGNKKLTGWKATLDRYRQRYQGEAKEMGKLAFEELSVELLGADHALVRGRFRLRMEKGTPTGIFTLILRKTPTGWRIIHDHTST